MRTKAGANAIDQTLPQCQALSILRAAGILQSVFNWDFLTSPDASDQRPEAAGLGVAIIGSAYMMLLVLITCVPVGVAASIYLEEFAPKNFWTDAIEVNIYRLRKKLEPFGCEIRTVRGMGYLMDRSDAEA